MIVEYTGLRTIKHTITMMLMLVMMLVIHLSFAFQIGSIFFNGVMYIQFKAYHRWLKVEGSAKINILHDNDFYLQIE